MHRPSILLCALLLACAGGEPTETPEPVEPVVEPAPMPAPQPRVFFVEPADGATVTSPLRVVMGVEGMAVEKAGEAVEGSGHHHLIVDGAFIAMGTVVPKDDTHFHYGDAQTEATIELAAGEHTLTMQFADGLHQSFGEALATSITVTVTEGSAGE